MIGYVGEGKMPPDEAMRGCLLLSMSISVLLVAVGAFVWLIAKSGCVS